HNS
ncbi:hypothetical protein CP8484711_1434B, partial [Chlamydia psittaci 84-8471/1]